MAPKRKEKYKLPVPLPEGKILDDMDGNQWALGKMIGSGGFGLIYLAFPTNKPNKDARHVIKVEYQENGPLFSELKFYQRAAKREYIQKWTAQRKLDYLGVPLFYGFGLTDFKGRSYRFMVMERLGIDLQKLSDKNGVFKKSTVLQLGIRVLDILEYIHENEYVHGDIKAANLLLGYTDPDRVYLADYGLSYRYCPNGNHKQYQENPRKGHNGTIEFTSLDAHRGVAPSRRSDVEILGYCMLHWLCGKLPWDKILDDPVAVQTAKTNLLDELPESVLTWAPPGTSCRELAQFLMCVHNLAYDEKPDYQKLKKILNPDGVYLGPLEFSTEAYTVHVHPTNCQKRAPHRPIVSTVYRLQEAEQKFMFNEKPLDFDLASNSSGGGGCHQTVSKVYPLDDLPAACATHGSIWVDSPKVTPKAANDLPEKFPKNVFHGASAPQRTEHEERQPRAVLSRAAARENSRRRNIYEYSDLRSEIHSFQQTPSYLDFQPSYWKPYLDCTSRESIRKPRSPQFRYTCPPGRAVSQLSLSEETKAEVYYYGLTIVCLLILVCLALYFL